MSKRIFQPARPPRAAQLNRMLRKQPAQRGRRAAAGKLLTGAAAVLTSLAAIGTIAITRIDTGAAQTEKLTGPDAVASQEVAGPPLHTLAGRPGRQPGVIAYGGTEALLKTPVSTLYPGGISTRPGLKNPVADDPAAAQRGMTYFNSFNCVGCHAANGGGGMGPALSNRFFIYGGSPADIYLTILQGRPHGMPAWGALLPDTVIWDLVAYITQISNAPHPEWGTTVSATSPAVEQVPAEFETTANPWAYTEPFSNGQQPASPAAAK